uniref:Putative secreted protein n=1 Tax=Xenopsylla cheopis TaxID=163159 RepID=A0A6M2DXT8_XENCH
MRYLYLLSRFQIIYLLCIVFLLFKFQKIWLQCTVFQHKYHYLQCHLCFQSLLSSLHQKLEEYLKSQQCR